jgi:hypothetical protein
VSSQSYLRIIDQHLAISLSRSYYTALRVIGDTEMAAALVIEAIESLDPENVTGETLRDAVVDVLVRAQMMPEHSAVRRLSDWQSNGSRTLMLSTDKQADDLVDGAVMTEE